MLDKKLSSLSEISKAQLSKILNSCAGTKDLILEPIIIKPLERVCGIRWLKANNIEKIFKLEDEMPNTQNPVFFLIYANYASYRKILKLIKERITETDKNRFHIVLIPKLLYVFENILEEMGLFGRVTLYSLQWQPIYLDQGVISLEIPHLYKTLFVQQDLSLLPVFAKSLWHLSFVIGKPRVHLALGQHSTAILRQLDLLYENLPNSDKLEADCGAVILLDRSIDYTSVLLTPATYSALLNEVYGVTCGMCEHKVNETEPHDSKFNPVLKKEPVQIILDSNHDSVYRDIKHRYFTEVTEILRVLTKSLRSEGESSREMALDEIKKYVSTQLQATASKTKFIANHLAAAQTIINNLGHRFEPQQETEQFLIQNKNKSGNYSYLEEILCTENNKHVALRLMCLMCITQKLSDGEIRTFWNKFLHEFGYYYGFLHNNLIKAGFLSDEATSTTSLPNLPNIVSKLPRLLSKDFYVNANKLKQIPSDPNKINLKAPTCCSYVFGGNYIPLITQIASMLLSNTPLNDIKAKLEPLGPLSVRNENGYPIQQRCIVLYVVGGVTYSEIAACSLLETLTGSKIIVCSDRVISGNDIMEALMDLS
ncbi:hypothetical protein RN001_014901 [Aquatica leii]|uniref:Vacuolar protein sorting-associated protein 33B n=1 Tax=Aquatica leii TaxID=1421715 RepID=A0AAN7PPY8_9COLE|nr:hypothetical protein RN001_014901 [Aquatica leii]